jgi:hypothetical protein
MNASVFSAYFVFLQFHPCSLSKYIYIYIYYIMIKIANKISALKEAKMLCEPH